MPKLTDSAIRAAIPREKQYKLFDERGLFLLVHPKGGRGWRLKYRIDGREKLLSLGSYPDVPLKRAREKRDEARSLIADGVDPVQARRADKAARRATIEGSFEIVAREWLDRVHRHAVVPAHFDRNLSRIERHLFPWLGSMPIGEITAAHLLQALRRVADAGHVDTAHRVKHLAGQIFRYAIVTGRAERDVAADLRGALPASRPKHHAAMTEPAAVGALLRSMQGSGGTFVVLSALRLAPYVFVRPRELRTMEWQDLDRATATWTIPSAKMKGGRDHVVPLSRQALAILDALAPLTGLEGFVFPANRGRGRPMSENTINAALRRLGYSNAEMTGHGFRAIARTLLDEELHERPDLIEHQLAHAVRDPNGRAYNRTSHLAERRRMMQRWADYLEQLREQRPEDPNACAEGEFDV